MSGANHRAVPPLEPCSLAKLSNKHPPSSSLEQISLIESSSPPPLSLCSMSTSASEFPPSPVHSHWAPSTSSKVHDSRFISAQESIHAIQHSHEFAVTYDTTIKNDLISFLTSSLKEFFVTVIMIKFDDKTIPAVLIITSSTAPSTLLDQLPDTLTADSECLWIHADGHFRKLSLPKMSNQRYEELISSSWSIGSDKVLKDDEESITTGTLGLIFRDGEKFVGLTAGHTVNDQPCTVFSPSITHFTEYGNELEEWRSILSQNEKPAHGKHIPIQKRERDSHMLEEIQEALDIVNAVKDYRVGSVLSKEECIVTHGDRRCLSDFALIDLRSSRVYGPAKWVRSSPTTGFLGSLKWQSAAKLGDITWDQYVRKTGAMSGLTFGVIAGVTAGVQHEGMTESTEEFYVMREERLTRLDFAIEGDSGSAVVTHDGMIVGMLFAGWEIDQVRMVMDRKGVVDIPHMRKYRLDDGTIDLVGYVQTRLMGKEFTLVQSMKMIVDRGMLANKELIIDL